MRVWLIARNTQMTSLLVFASWWGEFTLSFCLFKWLCLITPITRPWERQQMRYHFTANCPSACFDTLIFLLPVDFNKYESFSLSSSLRYCLIRPRDQSRLSFNHSSKSKYPVELMGLFSRQCTSDCARWASHVYQPISAELNFKTARILSWGDSIQETVSCFAVWIISFCFRRSET